VSQPDDPNLDDPPGLSLNYKQAGNLEFIKEKTARNVCYTKQKKNKKNTHLNIYIIQINLIIMCQNGK